MLLRQGRTRLWMAFALLNVALLAYQIGDFLYGIFGGAPTWPLRLTLGAAGFIRWPSSALSLNFKENLLAAWWPPAVRHRHGAGHVAAAVSPLALMPPARVAAAGRCSSSSRRR